MDISVDDKVHLFINNYNTLYKHYRWHVHDQVLMLISLIYVIHDKKLDLNELESVSKYIKEKTSFFSPLHSHQRFATSAVLIAKYNNPKEQADKLIDYYEKLLSAGFKNTSYTVTSALALLATDNDVNLEDRLKKAMDIYKSMKKNHFFLTSYSDYPLAVLLSKNNDTVDGIMNEVEYFYDELSKGPFKKGNALQFLSHIIMLSDTENKKFIVNRCFDLYNQLIKHGIKIKRLHYPQIGMMSIIDFELENEIECIRNITNSLNSKKRLKWLKDINLIIAITLVTTELYKNMHHDINIIEAGISTSIESIIEAQTAALLATICTTTTVNGSLT